MVKPTHQYDITSPPPGNISVRTNISVFAFCVCVLHFLCAFFDDEYLLCVFFALFAFWCSLHSRLNRYRIGRQVSACVVVTPIRWQRNLNLCVSPISSSESRPLDDIPVCTRAGHRDGGGRHLCTFLKVYMELGSYFQSVAALSLSFFYSVYLVCFGFMGESYGTLAAVSAPF
jgi:hypothetical protein